MVLSIGLAVLDNTASPESQQRTSWNTPLAEYKRLSFETNKVPAHTFSYSPVGGTKTIETNHKDKRNVALKVHRSPASAEPHSPIPENYSSLMPRRKQEARRVYICL